MSLALESITVRELLDYDKNTGWLTWRFRTRKWFTSDRQFKIWNSQNAGKRAGSVYQTKPLCFYRTVGLFNKRFLEHRLIWFYIHGFWPAQLDHENTDGTDNRLFNLRVATTSQNNMNRKMQKNNKSGCKGVSLHKGKWVAQIGHDTKIGRYDTIEEASLAYADTARTLFGKFARLT